MQFQQKYSPALLTLVLSLALAAAGSLVSTPVSVSAHGSAGSPQKSKDKKSKKEKKPTSAPTEAGTPIMWEDRGNIASLDLIHGIGNPESMPKAPFQFDKEDVTGTNPKIKVIDANGVKWNIKFDEEVHAEVAASRIAWLDADLARFTSCLGPTLDIKS